MKFKSKNLLNNYQNNAWIYFKKISYIFFDWLCHLLTGCSEKFDENDINFGIAQKPQQVRSKVSIRRCLKETYHS